MTERLLHFIWQFQYYNKSELSITTGEDVEIIHAGFYNRDQGPDFSNGQVKIGNTIWAGTIELHIRTSDWLKHQHQHDKNYGNVVLHVVWEHDREINNIPVLELNGRVAGVLLERFENLMRINCFIPCENMILNVPGLVWNSWKDRLLAERLTRKAEAVNRLLQQNNYHWEETCWWLLARNFGLPVNANVFEYIARSIDLSILARHRSQLVQVEALLLGQAGLLAHAFEEEYPVLLQREYVFLKKKYGLRPVHEPVHFLRMRPVNFPTVRLAQLAKLFCTNDQLFARIRDVETIQELRAYFTVTANDYWHYHYRFNEPAGFKEKKTGPSMVDSVIINTICPLLFAYGEFHNLQECKDKSLHWLGDLNAEQNNIVRGFKDIGVKALNSFDTQALIELKTQYCDQKNCLSCGVGNWILKQV